MVELTVPPAADGQRLDRWLKKSMPDVPFVAIQKMLREGKIRVNGKRAKGDARLQTNMVVSILSIQQPHQPTQNSSIYQLTNADKAWFATAVVFEDDALLVLNKPAGLAAQAGSGVSRSLDRILAAIYPANPPKLCHRLDKDTTGLIVLAKTRAAAQAVTASFANREVDKRYLALLLGSMTQPSGNIHAPLAKQSHAHGSRAVVDEAGGDAAHTSWRNLSTHHGHTLVEATPHTGRMNQLRAHFAHIGHAIVGDAKYGGPAAAQAAHAMGHPKTLFLHAFQITLPHPLTHHPLHLTAQPSHVWDRIINPR